MLKKRIFLFSIATATLATLCASHVDSDELWQFDVTIARKKAIDQKRLLIVVQFDSNFLLPIEGTEELENYQHHSLDEDSRAWISDHVILVAENVGRPPNIDVKLGKAAEQRLAKSAKPNHPDAQTPKSIGTCITWFCNSSGVVYGFLVGYPEPGDFWAEAKSIHASWQALEASPNQSAVGDWHSKQVVTQDRDIYRRQLKTSKSKNTKIHRRESIEYAVAAAAAVRRNRMLERFGDRDQRLLAKFGAFEYQSCRMLLASAHDADITELQRHVWQYLVGIRMWQADQEEILNWAEKQRSDKRAVLFRIQDQSDHSRWPPPTRPRLKELVNEFGVRENATIDDVAVIANYFKTEKLMIPVNRNPTFFVSTSVGDEYQLMSSEDGDSDLQKKMEELNTLEASRR